MKATRWTSFSLSILAGLMLAGAGAHASMDFATSAFAPEVDIEKLVNGHDADTPPGPSIVVGSAITWTYVVTNTGSRTLEDIVVEDSDDVTVFCPRTRLRPGRSMECSAFGTAAEGLQFNRATVYAFSGKADVFDTDVAYYTGVRNGGGGGEGDEGCTPGYWKNHLDAWNETSYDTTQTVESVFSAASAYSSATSDATLLEALDFSAGPTAEDMARALIRAAVAAVLNASHPDVDYPRAEATIINEVNAALATGNRAIMEDLKDELDADNNLGCPLD